MLFRIRSFAVQFVGLKGDGGSGKAALGNAIRQGGGHGLLSAAGKTGNETLIVLRNSHPDTYLSIHIREGDASLTVSAVTPIRFHNRLGRLYFDALKPFHKLTARRMLVRAVRNTAG